MDQAFEEPILMEDEMSISIETNAVSLGLMSRLIPQAAGFSIVNILRVFSSAARHRRN